MRWWGWIRVGAAALLAASAAGTAVHAQKAPTADSRDSMFLRPPPDSPGTAFVRFFTDAEWYFSWGFSKQYWSRSDIHVSQPGLGNDFTLHDVAGHDDPGLSGLNSYDLFGPQYNIRIGRFINDARTIAVELSLDHSKYEVTAGQNVHATGQIAGAPVNGNFPVNSTSFAYALHNGANHVMLNLVYRYPLIGKTNETFSVAGIGKVGAGIMVPHTSDTILGNSVDVGQKEWGNLFGLHSGWWQFGGWTTGAELGFRVVLWKPIYFEVTDKIAYASLRDLPAYQGTIQNNLWMNAVVFSLGFTYDGPSSR